MAKQVSPGVLALRKVVDDVHKDAREAKKRGELVGWSSSKFPCELAAAFDLNVMYPENQAAGIAANRYGELMCQAAEDLGYDNDICGYARISLAYAAGVRVARKFDPETGEDDEEQAFVASLDLLTWKPVIFAANVGEDDLADDGASNPHVQAVRKFASENDSEVFVVCAQIEEEISELDDDEKKMFLDDLGLKESGLDKLIAASYRLLGLISYLTAGEKETRAWTIKVGTKAPQAAGKIHTDFERGFIKAEVVNYKDLLDCGSYNGAKEKGLVRMEGKDYVMKDGDVVLFRFNV